MAVRQQQWAGEISSWCDNVIPHGQFLYSQELKELKYDMAIDLIPVINLHNASTENGRVILLGLQHGSVQRDGRGCCC